MHLRSIRRCSAILLVHVKRDAEIGCACFIRSLRALISSTNPFAGCLQGCRADISTCFDWIRIYGKGLRESNPAIWPFFVPSGNADLALDSSGEDGFVRWPRCLDLGLQDRSKEPLITTRYSQHLKNITMHPDIDTFCLYLEESGPRIVSSLALFDVR